MYWVSILIGIFLGLFLYSGYLLISTLIKRRKSKKNQNENVENDVEN